LGAPEATITTRLYRARQRVARELDPERCGGVRSNSTREACGRQADRARAASSGTARSINTTTTAALRAAHAR
jgi:hypothetical protein